jgi:hypothetical protein
VNSNTKTVPAAVTRRWPRFSNIKDLYLSYEGRSELFPVHPPDISPTGMFINTAADFPEDAILKVSFRLAKSNHPIVVRCEVRYCLAGVGVGVEFIDMSSTDQHAIAKETRTLGPTFKLQGDGATKRHAASNGASRRAQEKKLSTPRRKKR